MYPGDSEAAWPAALLSDPRVEHRWDEPKVVGTWFLHNLGSMRPQHDVLGKFPQRVDAMWDTWLLFDRKATWKGEKPSSVLSWGYTILHTKDQLARDLDALVPAKR